MNEWLNLVKEFEGSEELIFVIEGGDPIKGYLRHSALHDAYYISTLNEEKVMGKIYFNPNKLLVIMPV